MQKTLVIKGNVKITSSSGKTVAYAYVFAYVKTVCVQKVHDNDVLQTDKIRLIGYHVNALCTPALIRRSGLVALGKAHRLDKIKAGAVVARHR